MKCITRTRQLLGNNRGDFYVSGILFSMGILTFVMLICILLKCFIICNEVKKTTRQEMNNLSSIIAADIFNANKQGSLTEYYHKLGSSSAYQSHLENTTLDNISTDLKLMKENDIFVKYDTSHTPTYYLSGMNFHQENELDRIRYTVSFILTLNFRLGGKSYNGFSFPVSYDTHHIKNY